MNEIDEIARSLTERGWRINIKPHIVLMPWVSDPTPWLDAPQVDAEHWQGWHVDAQAQYGTLRERVGENDFIFGSVSPTILEAIKYTDKIAKRYEGS